MAMKSLAGKILTCFAVTVAVVALLSSCSSTKHVPQGKLLLDKVKINVSDPHKDVEPSQPTVTIESGPQLYGHDKILAEHHMTETEAWAELNRLFKEQEDLRRNNN
jgi:hypothetical protein